MNKSWISYLAPSWRFYNSGSFEFGSGISSICLYYPAASSSCGSKFLNFIGEIRRPILPSRLLLKSSPPWLYIVVVTIEYIENIANFLTLVLWSSPLNIIWAIVWIYSPKVLWNNKASETYNSFRCFKRAFNWLSKI